MLLPKVLAASRTMSALLAKGVTSLKLGVYLARPIVADGTISGVAVVRISLDSIRSHVEELSC